MRERQMLKAMLNGLDDAVGFERITTTLFAFSRAYVPPFLYRYRACGKEHSFDDIEACGITFAAPGVFEDKKDSAIHDTGEMDRAANMLINDETRAFAAVRSILEKVPADRRDGVVDYFEVCKNDFYRLSLSEREKAIRELVTAIRQFVDLPKINEGKREGHRIACLCQNRHSGYMWEKYGGDGNGYLIEYASAALLEVGSEFRQVPLILPVIYEERLPDTFLLPIIEGLREPLQNLIGEAVVDGIAVKETIKSLFCKLKKPFEKEEEWRMMIASVPQDGASRFISRTARPLCLIAGSKMSESDLEHLIYCAKKHGIAFQHSEKEPQNE